MINLGLTSGEQRSFEAALAAPHFKRTTVKITDLDHRHVSDISDRIVDGQVNVDWNATVSRSLNLTVLDHDRSVGLDSDDPTDGQLFLDRMVSVEYGVYVADLEEWVDVPIFHGPIIAVKRTDEEVEVEAQGKEYLAQREVWTQAKSWTRNTPRVTVLRSIMRDVLGERHFNLPHWTSRIPKNVSMSRMSNPWTWIRAQANAMGVQAFYDGRGILKFRKTPVKSIYTFRDKSGGVVITQPRMAYGTEPIKNVVLARGATPAGAKQPVESHSYLQAVHPHSGYRMARNGIAQFRVEVIEDDTWTSHKDTHAAAERRIKELLVDSIDVEFDSLPVPHLEEGDVVLLDAGGVYTKFRMKKWTIPLTHSGVSTVGYLRRVSHKSVVRAYRTAVR